MRRGPSPHMLSASLCVASHWGLHSSSLIAHATCFHRHVHRRYSPAHTRASTVRHRVVDNYHCDGLKYESRVSCHEGRVYGYVSVFKRHYAKHFDFSNYKRMECVISSGHEAAKANITVWLLTQRPRNQPQLTPSPRPIRPLSKLSALSSSSRAQTSRLV